MFACFTWQITDVFVLLAICFEDRFLSFYDEIFLREVICAVYCWWNIFVNHREVLLTTRPTTSYSAIHYYWNSERATDRQTETEREAQTERQTETDRELKSWEQWTHKGILHDATVVGIRAGVGESLAEQPGARSLFRQHAVSVPDEIHGVHFAVERSVRVHCHRHIIRGTLHLDWTWKQYANVESRSFLCIFLVPFVYCCLILLSSLLLLFSVHAGKTCTKLSTLSHAEIFDVQTLWRQYKFCQITDSRISFPGLMEAFSLKRTQQLLSLCQRMVLYNETETGDRLQFWNESVCFLGLKGDGSTCRHSW